MDVTSVPSRKMWPDTSGSSPTTLFRSVLFPAPFAPMIVTTWPFGISNETSRTAWIAPYDMFTQSSFNIASLLRCFRAEIGLDDPLVGLNYRGRPFRDLDPVVEYDNVVGDRHHQIHVMLDHQDRDAELADLDDQPAKLSRLLWVQAGGRFVEQEQLRLGSERPR